MRGDSKVSTGGSYPWPTQPLNNIQVFRFASSKNASLFLQRKNPRKIAWTRVYRRMHKKGLTEEVTKKRTRRTIKHQRGIVGADLATIMARRNQTAAVRTQARLAAITAAKKEKRAKEGNKDEKKATKVSHVSLCIVSLTNFWQTARVVTQQPPVPKYGRKGPSKGR